MSDMELKTREKPLSKKSKPSSISSFNNPMFSKPSEKGGMKLPSLNQGKLITSKLEKNRSKDNDQGLDLRFDPENRPNSVATAATKQHRTHSQINNFLMQDVDIPAESDSELTAKSDKIQFIYNKLGSK